MDCKYNPFFGRMDAEVGSEPLDGTKVGDLVLSEAVKDLNSYKVIDTFITNYDSYPISRRATNAAPTAELRVFYQYDRRGRDLWCFCPTNDNGGTVSNAVMYINADTEQWTSGFTTAPVTLREGGVAYDPKRDIFFFGIGGTNYLCTSRTQNLWSYDPNSNTWTQLAPLTLIDAFSTSMVVWGDYLFVMPCKVGSSTTSFSLSYKMFIYDIENDSWELYHTFTAPDNVQELCLLNDNGDVLCRIKNADDSSQYLALFNLSSPDNIDILCNVADYGLTWTCNYCSYNGFVFIQACGDSSGITYNTVAVDTVTRKVVYPFGNKAKNGGNGAIACFGDKVIVAGGYQYDNNLVDVYDIKFISRLYQKVS